MKFELATRAINVAALSACCISTIGTPAGAASNGAAVDPQERHAVVVRLAAALRDRYVFPEKGTSAAEALLRDENSGRFTSFTDGAALARALNDSLQARLHDLHLSVDYSEAAQPQRKDNAEPTEAEYRKFAAMVARRNYGIDAVERLAGNVGYLRISGFPDAALMMNPLAHAMSLLAGTDALIIDMRDNRGGDPDAVNLLASYFFAPWKSLHFNDILRRVPATTSMEVHQYWSVAVPGPPYLDRPVSILTNSETVSAGEGFTYHMQVLKRATVVGARTAGGANPMREVWLDPHFSAGIPYGRAVDPITKSNWEGTGVTPDVITPSAHAPTTAYIGLLKTRMAHATDDREREELRNLIETAAKNPASIFAL